MIIELTRAEKVVLLEAVKSGVLDLTRLDRGEAANAMSRAAVVRELCRLETLHDFEYIKAVAGLMHRFAAGEIDIKTYTRERLLLEGLSDSETTQQQ